MVFGENWEAKGRQRRVSGGGRIARFDPPTLDPCVSTFARYQASGKNYHDHYQSSAQLREVAGEVAATSSHGAAARRPPGWPPQQWRRIGGGKGAVTPHKFWGGARR